MQNRARDNSAPSGRNLAADSYLRQSSPFRTAGDVMTSERTRPATPEASQKQEEADMSLPKRSLGLSGVPITVTGFGAWALGGGGWAYSWGPQDDNESIRTIRHALEQGINWIDTAAVYGLGHPEQRTCWGRLKQE